MSDKPCPEQKGHFSGGSFFLATMCCVVISMMTLAVADACSKRPVVTKDGCAILYDGRAYRLDTAAPVFSSSTETPECPNKPIKAWFSNNSEAGSMESLRREKCTCATDQGTQ